MARPLRLCFDNAVYHVMARGNRKDSIFYSEPDKKIFLEQMNDTFIKYSIVCYSYCLMSTHYHLFIKTRLPNLSQAMHYLNSSYANWFKAKHRIIGVVFQGRYKSILVEENRYALTLSTYIHLNPIRSKLVRSLRQYPWSSYLDYIGGRRSVIERLDTSLVHGLVAGHAEPAPGLSEGEMAGRLQILHKIYENYVLTMEKMKNPLDEAHKGIILGGPDFIERIEKRIGSMSVCREIPSTNIRLPRPMMPEDLVNIMTSSLGIKKETILMRRGVQRRSPCFQLLLYLLKKATPLSLKEIGSFVDMDYAAVHQAVKRFGERLTFDAAAKAAKDKVEKAIAVWMSGGVEQGR